VSIRLIDLVWTNAPYSGAKLLVLLALADWANDDGWCYPSQSTIAAKARVDRRRVKRILGELMEDGVVERIVTGGRSGEGEVHTWPSQYRLRTDWLAQMPAVYQRSSIHKSSARGVPRPPLGGSMYPPRRGGPVPPPPAFEQSTKPSLDDDLWISEDGRVYVSRSA
jgi:hypothetical protein